MEPLALAAIAGFVYLSSKNDTTPQTRQPIRQLDLDLGATGYATHLEDTFDLKNVTPDAGRRVGDIHLAPKREFASFEDIAPSRRPFGQPVYDFSSRQDISMKMNNLSPMPLVRVGPGLGLDPSVPAAGGFQQFFQIRPHNINEEKLVTLPGGKGPSDALVKAAAGIGAITHQASESKTSHRIPVRTRGQGQGGALTAVTARGIEVATQRPTIRSETGLRGDTLEFGTAQSIVSQGRTYDPTILSQSVVTNRSNPDRAGNAGRMNVRGDPVQALGAMGRTRLESVTQPIGAVNGTRFQYYLNESATTTYNVKGQTGMNPYATNESLDVAIRQLDKNGLSIRPLSLVSTS